VVSKIHGILKPFLLRRLKTDVEISLPRKMEVLLYAPMSEDQRRINTQLREKTLLVSGAAGGAAGALRGRGSGRAGRVGPLLAGLRWRPGGGARTPAAARRRWRLLPPGAAAGGRRARAGALPQLMTRHGARPRPCPLTPTPPPIPRPVQGELVKKAQQEGGSTASVAQLNNVLMQMRKNCNHPDLITSQFSGFVDMDYPSPEVRCGACACCPCGHVQLQRGVWPVCQGGPVAGAGDPGQHKR
jgi:SNF2 family DNA or RNA helicase